MAIRELSGILSIVRQVGRAETRAGRHIVLYSDADSDAECVCHPLMWRDNVL